MKRIFSLILGLCLCFCSADLMVFADTIVMSEKVVPEVTGITLDQNLPVHPVLDTHYHGGKHPVKYTVTYKDAEPYSGTLGINEKMADPYGYLIEYTLDDSVSLLLDEYADCKVGEYSMILKITNQNGDNVVDPISFTAYIPTMEEAIRLSGMKAEALSCGKETFVEKGHKWYTFTPDADGTYELECPKSEFGVTFYNNDNEELEGEYKEKGTLFDIELKKGVIYYVCLGNFGNGLVTYSMKYPVQNISLDKTELRLYVGETSRLTSTVVPANATFDNVVWGSSEPDVATVDNKGVVRGVGKGTAIITAVTDNGIKMANCKVTVYTVPTNGVGLNKTSLTLDKDKAETLIAIVGPAHATDKAIKWKSDNTAIATVDSKGKVNAVGKGTANIYATAADGSGCYAVCTVTVKIPATRITVAKKALTLKKGAKLAISTIVTPSNTTDTITFKSSKPKTVSVTNKGKITAKKKGSATITIKAGFKSVKVKVNVVTKTKKVKKLSFTKKKLTVKKGKVQFLSYKVNPSTATQILKWKSSKKSVVSVDSNGKITAKKKGTAKITVYVGKKKATIKIMVK